MAQGQRERSRDFERFVTFIDAVVAIAITLLVLPLVDLTVDFEGSVTVLLRNLAEIGGFLLSFIVIANAWFAQHRAISTVVAQDRLVSRLMIAGFGARLGDEGGFHGPATTCCCYC